MLEQVTSGSNFFDKHPGATRLSWRRRVCGGLTLIEIIVVTAILAILVAVAGPAMHDMVLRKRLQAAAEQISEDMKVMHRQSLQRTKDTAIHFSSLGSGTSEGCYIAYMINSATQYKCNCANSAPMCETAPRGVRPTIINLKYFRSSDGITMTSANALPNYVEFKGPDFVARPASTTKGVEAQDSFAITLSAESVGALTISNSKFGQVIICQSSGFKGQYPDCPEPAK